MVDIKEIWKVFKMSSMQDKDMQRAFHRAATPNACILLLEEIDELKGKLAAYENPKNWMRSFDRQGRLTNEHALYRPKLRPTREDARHG